MEDKDRNEIEQAETDPAEQAATEVDADEQASLSETEPSLTSDEAPRDEAELPVIEVEEAPDVAEEEGTDTGKRPWSTKKKVVTWSLVALAAVLTAVLLVGNIVYYWYLYFYIYYKRISFDIANRSAESGHVVFVGDSITDGCDLDKYYPTLSAYNRGIAGQTSGDLLQDMDNHIYELEPSLVVLLIGTNDYQRARDHSNAHILSNYRKILQGIYDNCPNTKVIVQSMYPISDVKYHRHYHYGHGHIEEFNEALAAMAAEYGYTYADVYSVLTVGDEEMNPAYSDDGLHPNDAGYRAISAYLTPIIEDMLAEE